MSWGKFDDQYPDHPKIREVGPLGMALHTSAAAPMLWSTEELEAVG